MDVCTHFERMASVEISTHWGSSINQCYAFDHYDDVPLVSVDLGREDAVVLRRAELGRDERCQKFKISRMEEISNKGRIRAGRGRSPTCQTG